MTYAAATLRRHSPYVCAALLGVAIGLVVARQPLIAVVLIAVTVGGVIVVTRPDLVLLVMIAALPWENKLHYPSASLSAVSTDVAEVRTRSQRPLRVCICRTNASAVAMTDSG